MMVIAWIIAIAAWAVILLSPVAVVALAVVPPLRRWWLRPLQRRRAARRIRKGARRELARTMEQLRRDAREAVLETELQSVTEREP